MALRLGRAGRGVTTRWFEDPIRRSRRLIGSAALTAGLLVVCTASGAGRRGGAAGRSVAQGRSGTWEGGRARRRRQPRTLTAWGRPASALRRRTARVAAGQLLDHPASRPPPTSPRLYADECWNDPPSRVPGHLHLRPRRRGGAGRPGRQLARRALVPGAGAPSPRPRLAGDHVRRVQLLPGRRTAELPDDPACDRRLLALERVGARAAGHPAATTWWWSPRAPTSTWPTCRRRAELDVAAEAYGRELAAVGGDRRRRARAPGHPGVPDLGA